MSELWMFCELKEEKILNTLEISPCPNALEKSQKWWKCCWFLPRVFLCSLFPRIVCFLFRPCQHISRAFPECLIHY